MSLPCDLADTIEYRLYLDRALERVAMQDLQDPPRYVLHTPVLFEHWMEWADQHQRHQQQTSRTSEIRPLGEAQSPDWMRTEFSDFELFYQYYLELLDYGR